jgi:hypothetical protein
MPTLRQIQAVFSPILADHPDLMLWRRWLIKPPITNAVCGLHIGRTSSAWAADIVFTVIPLSRFLPPSAVGFEVPFVVRDTAADEPRILDDVFAPDYQAQLLATFDAKARPLLDTMTTFDGIVQWVSRFREPPLRMTAIERIDAWLCAMRGEFSAAAAHLKALSDRRAASGHAAEDDVTMLEGDALRVLRTGDPTAIATFLHDLERRTVTAYGLARHWQPTPLPFEQTPTA